MNFGALFTGFKDNLTKLEAVLVGLLAVQGVVVGIVQNVPTLARYVSIGFAVVSALALFIKNVVANMNAPAPPAALRPGQSGQVNGSWLFTIVLVLAAIILIWFLLTRVLTFR